MNEKDFEILELYTPGFTTFVKDNDLIGKRALGRLDEDEELEEDSDIHSPEFLRQT